MKNLSKLITLEAVKRQNELLKDIRKIDFCDASKLHWTLSDLLPKGKQNASFKSVTELKTYLVDRLKKRTECRIIEQQTKLVFSENLQPIDSITITVDWKKSQMWGMNPNAECFISGLGTLKSGSVSGCGYDKLSTAVSNILNQIPQFLQLMYIVKNKNYKKSNRECLGYGSGYGILPTFEGGVGVGCYDRIFTNIGYKFETVSSGKTFDVFRISKISRKEQKDKLQRLYNYKN
jgi:hypothetical protein